MEEGRNLFENVTEHRLAIFVIENSIIPATMVFLSPTVSHMGSTSLNFTPFCLHGCFRGKHSFIEVKRIEKEISILCAQELITVQVQCENYLNISTYVRLVSIAVYRYQVCNSKRHRLPVLHKS